MKKNFKWLAMLMVMVMVLSFTACGGGNGSGGAASEPSPYEGKWIAIIGEMMGMQVGVEEVTDGELSFTLDNKGKAKVVVGDNSGSGKYVVEGDQFTLTLEGEDMVGTLGDNVIIFDDFLGMGVKMYFAKEGTPAMDPSLYLPEDVLKMIGDWHSDSVEELLGDGPQTELEGVDDISDGLRMTFDKDKNVSIKYKGTEIGSYPWEMALGYCSIEIEDPAIYVTVNDDDTLEVVYSDSEDYLTFHMVKAE